MDIEAPLRELGPVDMAALQDAILGQEEAAWSEHSYRQQEYDVHKDTASIVLVFTHGENWPQSEILKEAGWDRLSDVAVPMMHDIIGRCYPQGGTIIRAMVANLLSGGKITPHRDHHPLFHAAHRIHVPITTNSRVRFMIDGQPYRFEVGKAYELNNQKTHSVMNKGKEGRITFIFDYLPPRDSAQPLQQGIRSGS